MSQLSDALEKVKDENLTLIQVEALRDTLVHLFTAIVRERAEKQKAEAMFFLHAREVDPDIADIAIKRRWRVTPDGLRLLELEAYKSALPKEIASLQSRAYSLIR